VARRYYRPEESITKLREAEVLSARGKKVAVTTKLLTNAFYIQSPRPRLRLRDGFP